MFLAIFAPFRLKNPLSGLYYLQINSNVPCKTKFWARPVNIACFNLKDAACFDVGDEKKTKNICSKTYFLQATHKNLDRIM